MALKGSVVRERWGKQEMLVSFLLFSCQLNKDLESFEPFLVGVPHGVREILCSFIIYYSLIH